MLGYSVGGGVSAFVVLAFASSFHHGEAFSASRTSPASFGTMVEGASAPDGGGSSVRAELHGCFEGAEPGLRPRFSSPLL